MRLAILDHGHRPLQKLQFTILGALVGEVPGPIKIMSYRRKLFGKYLAQCLQEAMRQAREWSAGECEILAAFVSNLERCRF